MSSTPKHTPGKWEAWQRPDGRWAVLDQFDHVLASVERDGTSDSPPRAAERAANAHLMAAAPEYLALLTEVRMVLDRYAEYYDLEGGDASEMVEMVIRIDETTPADSREERR